MDAAFERDMPAFGDVLIAAQIVDMPDLVKLSRLENVSGFAESCKSYAPRLTPAQSL
jgi:hypothetical protein